MKVRCPSCGYISNSCPPTHKCPECEVFSHEWLIYDWESFASIKRQHIKYNLLIIGALAINLLMIIALGSSSDFQWMLNLLFIPATISLFYCLKHIRGKTEYEGHKSGAILPWFSGF